MNILADRQGDDYTPEILRDPALEIVDRDLVRILEIWRGLADVRSMPSRADIHPRIFLPYLPHIALIDVQRAPLRVRYRLVGTGITNALRRELTGRWYDEVYSPAIMAEVNAVYSWIVAHRKPLRTSGIALFFDRRFYDYEVVNLPLSNTGEEVEMVLAAIKFTLAKGDPARRKNRSG